MISHYYIDLAHEIEIITLTKAYGIIVFHSNTGRGHALDLHQAELIPPVNIDIFIRYLEDALDHNCAGFCSYKYIIEVDSNDRHIPGTTKVFFIDKGVTFFDYIFDNFAAVLEQCHHHGIAAWTEFSDPEIIVFFQFQGCARLYIVFLVRIQQNLTELSLVQQAVAGWSKGSIAGIACKVAVCHEADYFVAAPDVLLEIDRYGWCFVYDVTTAKRPVDIFNGKGLSPYVIVKVIVETTETLGVPGVFFVWHTLVFIPDAVAWLKGGGMYFKIFRITFSRGKGGSCLKIIFIFTNIADCGIICIILSVICSMIIRINFCHRIIESIINIEVYWRQRIVFSICESYIKSKCNRGNPTCRWNTIIWSIRCMIPNRCKCPYFIAAQSVSCQIGGTGSHCCRVSGAVIKIWVRIKGCNWIIIGYCPGNRTWRTAKIEWIIYCWFVHFFAERRCDTCIKGYVGRATCRVSIYNCRIESVCCSYKTMSIRSVRISNSISTHDLVMICRWSIQTF